jgi:Plasmid pRiA4b ORF-3-like protein.
VDGAGTCPPEDCGGTPGYSDLKVILADPAHEEHHAVAHRPCYATPRQDVRADLAS